jgi:hypothetical protein
MKQTNPALNAFRSAVTIIAAIIVTFIMLLGLIPSTKPTLSSGHFFLTAIENGVGIYKPSKYSSFIISSYNDRLITPYGQEIALSELFPINIAKQTNVSEIFSRYQTVWNRILLYLGMTTKITSLNGPVTYEITTHQNEILATRSIRFIPNDFVNGKRVMSLTYSRDDLVFNTEGILYTENKDVDIETIEQISGMKLLKNTSEQRKPTVDSTSIILVNPKITGVLTIKTNQCDVVTVDKDNKRIVCTKDNNGEKKATDNLMIGVSELSDLKNNL